MYTKEHVSLPVLRRIAGYHLLAELIERVKADLLNHIGRAPQSDDITMIAVHRKA